MFISKFFCNFSKNEFYYFGNEFLRGNVLNAFFCWPDLNCKIHIDISVTFALISRCVTFCLALVCNLDTFHFVNLISM